MDILEIDLSPRMKGLLSACEQDCVADCCGILAFDFSPLYAASYLVQQGQGHKFLEGVETLGRELDSILEQGLAQTPDERGFVCLIAAVNSFFSKNDLQVLVDRIHWTIAQAATVIDCVNQLEKTAPPRPVYKAT